MAETKILILLDNSQNSNYPGGTISGQVVVSNSKTETIKGIHMMFEGKANINCRLYATNATTYSGYNRRTHHTSQVETLYNWKLRLLYRGGRTIKLQTGFHVYPFAFRLPLDTPPSFLGSKGKIEYTITATLKKKFKSNKSAVVGINVSNFVDLNLIPNAMTPIIYQGEEWLPWYRCSGPIEILFEIPKRGFIPEESITSSLCINNRSKYDVTRCDIDLVQEVTYKSRGLAAIHEKKYPLLRTAPTAARHTETFTTNIKVPNVLVTNRFVSKRIAIGVRYMLELDVQLSGWAGNICKRFEIVIGSVPIQNQSYYINPQQMQRPENVNQFNWAATAPNIETGLPPYASSPDQDHPHDHSPLLNSRHEHDNVSISSEVSLPPTYQTYDDLPPSYAEAISAAMEENKHSSS